MFTGIVEEVGGVVEVSDTGLGIRASLVMEDIAVSDSISVNGACLTVTRIQGDAFWVDTVPETRRRTNLGRLSAGSPVNLERPLRADGRFGGHAPNPGNSPRSTGGPTRSMRYSPSGPSCPQ